MTIEAIEGQFTQISMEMAWRILLRYAVVACNVDCCPGQEAVQLDAEDVDSGRGGCTYVRSTSTCLVYQTTQVGIERRT